MLHLTKQEQLVLTLVILLLLTGLAVKVYLGMKPGTPLITSPHSAENAAH